MSRRAAITLACLVLSCGAPSPARAAAVPAGEATRLFSNGNESYGAGKFEEASKQYRQLLNQGIDASAVHYNLGNALYKLGKMGPAILEFEKALALSPNDADIRANLDFVRSLTVDKPADSGAQTTSFFIEKLLTVTTINQDAAAFTLLWILLGGLAMLLLSGRSHRLRRAATWAISLLAIPAVVVGATLTVKCWQAVSESHAVVLSERLDVRSGPGDENTTLFTVHEGLKVRVRTQQGSWSQVTLDNGLSGWVPLSSLGII